MLLGHLLEICFLALLFHLSFTQFVHAYLDPGTGSYLFQLLIAGLVGLLFAVKVYWRRIKSLVTGLLSRGKEMDMTEEDEKA